MTPIVLNENRSIIDAVWFTPLSGDSNSQIGVVKVFDKHDGWLFFVGNCVSFGISEKVDAQAIAARGAPFRIKSLRDFFNIFDEVR